MEKIARLGRLYDFYGELLTERQREICEAYVEADLSLGEISGQEGSSRQAVHDMLSRCLDKLEGYERKLHLMESYDKNSELLNRMQEMIRSGTAGDELLRLTEELQAGL
ncbi:MAG: YlxM family DNA-binding protein [Lachnospiraceae bacterium]|nr:YlxM family DNA-binding protein [Lachnospiraceae bacterium]